MKTESTISVPKHDTKIGRLRKEDLGVANHIFRLAFGTFLGAPEPEKFFGDQDYVNTRWIADPDSAFGAWKDDTLVGSNFATNWGSVGFFGPLSVHPALWEQKVAQRLMEPIVLLFDNWGIQLAGLFTFSHSPKHVSLYQKYGFMPRHLTMIMSKSIERLPGADDFELFSAAKANQVESIVTSCNEMTDAVYEGLSVESELKAVLSQNLGDVVLINDSKGLAGVAVCHIGAGTEAGGGVCYLKFAAARPGSNVSVTFERLLSACEHVALAREAKTLVAGVNSAREQCYRQMRANGFRIDLQGVAMTRESDRSYNREDVFLIDDWR